MANRIILKRNVGLTGPTGGQLVPGEPAIAMDGPTGANSKLYVGIADTVTGSVDNVVAIGGGYYTIFVDDIYSKKSIIQGTEQSFTTALRSKITGNETAIAAITGAYVTGGNVSQFANNSGYLTSSTGLVKTNNLSDVTASTARTNLDLDEIYTKKSIIQATTDSFTTGLHSDITGNTAAIAAITGAYVTGGNVSQFANDSGYVTTHGHNYVHSFNGATGDVIGVSSVNGVTGAVINVVTGGGAPTFSGMTLSGDLLLPEDGVIQIGGDTEKIVFNGAGSGSSSIDISVGMVDFGLGSGCKLRSHGDLLGTYIEFVNDAFGSGRDGLDIYVDDKRFVDISTQGTLSIPTGGLNVTGNVTVEGNLNIAEDGYIGVGAGDERIIFDGDSGDITLETNIVYIKGALAHTDDADTKLSFNDNRITLRAGATDWLSVDHSRGGVKILSGGLHVTGGVKTDGLITGSNIPASIVTGGNVSQFANNAVYLTAANNLSDVTASTARTNLDLDEIYTKKSIIEGTEQSFTTTLKNKLDAIEASADVTDATNVAAANVAGAGFVTGTLDFGISGNDEVISKVTLKDYGEKIHYIGTSASPTFNFENGNVQHCTGSSGMAGGNSITLSNPPPNGVAGTMTVICINCGLIPNASGFWPSTIKWPGNVEPTLSSSGTDIFSVMTVDGGANYYGFMGGMQFA